jgi:exodeoxyribonuclease V alpha subunit
MRGDEGIVLGYDRKSNEVMVRFDDKTVLIPPTELSVTFALTIHKSQGSEWKYVAVYLPQSKSYDFVDYRMIYTAITRSKTKIWVVGKMIHHKRPDPHDNLSYRIIKSHH